MIATFPTWPALTIWIGYLALAGGAIWRFRRPQAGQHRAQSVEHALLGLLLLAQMPVVLSPLLTTPPFFGAREALMLGTWLAVTIYWSCSFFMRLEGLQSVLLPVACAVLGLSLVLPAGHAVPRLGQPVVQVHFAVAMLAYGFLGFATGIAALMHLADRALHHPASSLFRQLPPLLALERLLFVAMGTGFMLLSAALLTGMLFSETLFGRAMPFNHKTVFSIAAWLVFGTLLWGRRTRGWRGKTAVKGTLAGFVLLLLAYVGSRFVLDIVLQRG
jgi:ABC-type uncharacterized transport system permease subunit